MPHEANAVPSASVTVQLLSLTPHSPLQLQVALGTQRLLGHGLLEVKGQDALGWGQAAAGVLPQWVGLSLLAFPEVQGTLGEEEDSGI